MTEIGRSAGLRAVVRNMRRAQTPAALSLLTRLWLAGESTAKIAGHLNDRSYRTATGGAWTAASVYSAAAYERLKLERHARNGGGPVDPRWYRPPEEVPAILVRLWLDGESMDTIIKYLQANGYPTSSRKPWTVERTYSLIAAERLRMERRARNGGPALDPQWYRLTHI